MKLYIISLLLYRYWKTKVQRPKVKDDAKSIANSGTDKDGKKSDDSGSESEENTGGIRMMKFLNRYSAPSNSPQKAAPKGKARPKAAASATVKQQNRSTGSVATKSKNAAEQSKNEKESKPQKTVVGNAGY